MCNFISWIEKNGEILFLTANDIFNTKRGRELQKHTTPDDFIGHGAIEFFYRLEYGTGKHLECEDFSSPKNFPPQIVSAIKRLQFVGLGTPMELLSKTARAEYRKIEQTALAEYRKIEHTALAEYRKIEQPAWAEYEKIEQTAFWKLFRLKKNRAKAWR
jgi:hypothetical protein